MSRAKKIVVSPIIGGGEGSRMSWGGRSQGGGSIQTAEHFGSDYVKKYGERPESF